MSKEKKEEKKEITNKEEKEREFVNAYADLVVKHKKELVAGITLTKLNKNQKNTVLDFFKQSEDDPFIQDYMKLVDKTGYSLSALLVPSIVEQESFDALSDMGKIDKDDKPKDDGPEFESLT